MALSRRQRFRIHQLSIGGLWLEYLSVLVDGVSVGGFSVVGRSSYSALFRRLIPPYSVSR